MRTAGKPSFARGTECHGLPKRDLKPPHRVVKRTKTVVIPSRSRRLRGNSVQSLDEKNRSPLSAEFHETFKFLSELYPAQNGEKSGGLTVVASKSINNRLAIYPVGIYERITEALLRNVGNALAKRLLWDLEAWCHRSTLDPQRRFKLPAEYANTFLRDLSPEQIAESKDSEGEDRKGKSDDEEPDRKGSKAMKIALVGRGTYIELLTVADYARTAKSGPPPASEFHELIASSPDLQEFL